MLITHFGGARAQVVRGCESGACPTVAIKKDAEGTIYVTLGDTNNSGAYMEVPLTALQALAEVATANTLNALRPLGHLAIGSAEERLTVVKGSTHDSGENNFLLSYISKSQDGPQDKHEHAFVEYSSHDTLVLMNFVRSGLDQLVQSGSQQPIELALQPA